MPSYCEPRCLNIERTEIIHKALDIPVVAVGNITTIEAAEDIIANDRADVVAMARSLLADTDFIKKAYRGDTDTIRPCLRCIECAARPSYGGGVRCAVNPQLGRETRYSTIDKASESKKVLIIGGGPAGMQAAQIASRRGHEVVLYEKKEQLGGRLREASVMFKKADTHKKYLEWDIKQTYACGARIELGKEFTPEIVAAEKPDVIINASGGSHIIPNIPGIDCGKVISITDAELKLAHVGEKVVMLGAGISGLEGAIQLAHEGHDVTIIDRFPVNKLWREVMNELRSGLIEQMLLHDIKMVDDATVINITDEYVEYRKESGELGRLEGDTYVTSFGIKRNKEFNQMVRDLIPDVYVVGDAREPNNIFWANMDAFNIAVEV